MADDDIRGLIGSVQDYLVKGGLDKDARYYLGPHAYEGLSNIASLLDFFGPGADVKDILSESAKVMEGDLAAFVGLPAALAMMAIPGSKSGIEEVTKTAVQEIPYPSIKETWWKDELADKGSVTLYHGAAQKNLDSILKSGLKADRQGFSYLTPDPATGTGYAVMSGQGGEKAFKGAKKGKDTPVEERVLLQIEVPAEAILENMNKQRSPTSKKKLIEESGENFAPTVRSDLGQGKYTEPYYSLTEFRLNQDIPSEWITGYAVKKSSGGIVQRNPYNYKPRTI